MTALVLALLLSASGCDRNVEPFVPGETPEQPDLSRIFPEGADRAARKESGEPAPRAVAGGEPIRGTVRVSDELVARVPPGAVLFLIARREGGVPIAAKRIAAPRFPLEFEIGPADRMTQGTPFAGPVSLSARLDSDGSADSRTPGDLEGRAPQPVQPGQVGVEIVIDEAL